MGLLSRYINKLLSLSLPDRDFADSKVDVWQWDIDNNYFNVNRFWYEKLGYGKSKARTLERILTLIHPDDLENFKNELDKFLDPSNKKEIDFVLEIASKIVAIEVKCAKSVNIGDFKHMLNLRENTKAQFDKGIVFYNGERVLRFDANLYALPFGFLC